MSSATIAAKITAALARVQSAVGSSESEPVYLVSKTTIGSTILASGITTETDVLLTNAQFKDYNSTTESETIKAGDRMLVCDNSVVISQGDTIKQGISFYTVVSVDIKAPTSDVLAYIAQVRKK